MLPESEPSQSSAAGCGTKRIRIRAGLCVRSGVDRAWEIQSEHNDKSSFLVQPLAPPIPLPHHHLLLLPPGKSVVFPLTLHL